MQYARDAIFAISWNSAVLDENRIGLYKGQKGAVWNRTLVPFGLSRSSIAVKVVVQLLFFKGDALDAVSFGGTFYQYVHVIICV